MGNQFGRVLRMVNHLVGFRGWESPTKVSLLVLIATG